MDSLWIKRNAWSGHGHGRQQGGVTERAGARHVGGCPKRSKETRRNQGRKQSGKKALREESSQGRGTGALSLRTSTMDGTVL